MKKEIPLTWSEMRERMTQLQNKKAKKEKKVSKKKFEKGAPVEILSLDELNK